MRQLLWVSVLVACGGKAPAPQPPPSNVSTTTQPTEPAAPAVLTKEVCAQRADEFGPVPLRAEQVALRRGTGAKKLGDIATTKDAPIEVCMPVGEREWLASVTCADGTAPTSRQRSGSVGPGGTCGSIIDAYIVKCPEKDYELFMDMYMCPPGAGM